MKKESDKEQERRNRWYVGEPSELHSSEWYGAILRYLSSYGKKEFNSIYTEEESRKNILIGWQAKVVLLIGAIATLIMTSS